MVIGFDAKDFKRSKFVEKGKQTVFYSPLGVGVETQDSEGLRASLVQNVRQLNESFNLPSSRVIHCSSSLMEKIGHRKAIPYFDNLVKSLEESIDSFFVTYAVLPPKSIPSVEVGGYRSPKTSINTWEFLRSLASSFPYITAWSYCGRHRESECRLLIDSFSGKETMAWEDLKERSFEIYSRGDECNEVIALADMIACPTDKKLYDEKKFLTPDSVEEIWQNYDFDVEVRFLDEGVLSKIKWISDEQIDVAPFLAHPIIFLDLDLVNMTRFAKFGLYDTLTSFAFHKRGGIQGFDVHLDTNKIRDGDIYAYAGTGARERANTFKDIYI